MDWCYTHNRSYEHCTALRERDALLLQNRDLLHKLTTAADTFHLESDHHQSAREDCGNATCERLTEWIDKAKEGQQTEKRVEPTPKCDKCGGGYGVTPPVFNRDPQYKRLCHKCDRE